MNLIDAAIIIEAQAKLIKQQAFDIIDLEHLLEQKEYNRRYTNTKHLKPAPPVAQGDMVSIEKRKKK